MKRLVFVVLVCVAFGLAGCGPKVPAADKLAAEQKAQCLKTQGTIEQTMKLFYADTGTYPPLETVLAKLQATCPSGGKYAFDEKTEKTSCSIHGSP